MPDRARARRLAAVPLDAAGVDHHVRRVDDTDRAAVRIAVHDRQRRIAERQVADFRSVTGRQVEESALAPRGRGDDCRVGAVAEELYARLPGERDRLDDPVGARAHVDRVARLDEVRGHVDVTHRRLPARAVTALRSRRVDVDVAVQHLRGDAEGLADLARVVADARHNDGRLTDLHVVLVTVLEVDTLRQRHLLGKDCVADHRLGPDLGARPDEVGDVRDGRRDRQRLRRDPRRERLARPGRERVGRIPDTREELPLLRSDAPVGDVAPRRAFVPRILHHAARARIQRRHEAGLVRVAIVDAVKDVLRLRDDAHRRGIRGLCQPDRRVGAVARNREERVELVLRNAPVVIAHTRLVALEIRRVDIGGGVVDLHDQRGVGILREVDVGQPGRVIARIPKPLAFPAVTIDFQRARDEVHHMRRYIIVRTKIAN